MTSKEHKVCEEELEYDDVLGVSKDLLYEFSDDWWRSLLNEDGAYLMEMPQDMNLERNEENGFGDEMDDIHLVHFLEEFPTQKKKIEKFIQCLQEIADSIDKTHKDCTIATIAANSGGATASILSILGLTLAPVTAGGSLILSAAGMGLGAMAGITGLSTAVSENVVNSKELKRAEDLITKCQKSLRNIYPHRTYFQSECPVNNGNTKKIIKQLVSSAASQFPKIYEATKGIQRNVKVLKIVKANPAMKALAKRAAATGSTSRKTISGIRKAFAGTPLAMTKGVRILGAASLGLFLLFDVYNIAQDAKHITEGAKAKTAEEIREKTKELEEELYNLNKLYEELKEVF
nr:apolipoprotein L6-like [Anolis sagrei ordinatus]XP_060632945.1 apolipoprotein L6-like [Anolis sagrei ordinatus]